MMEWVEIIRLLGAPGDVQALRDAMGSQLDGLRGTPGLKRAMVMLNAMYATDFAVALVWENRREPVKTREGLLIASALLPFGSVDHAVWRVLDGCGFQMADANPPNREGGKSR